MSLRNDQHMRSVCRTILIPIFFLKLASPSNAVDATDESILDDLIDSALDLVEFQPLRRRGRLG